MNRNLKALGVALCAVFVVGALWASAASAVQDSFTSVTFSGTTYLTGEQIGGIGATPPNVFGTKSSAGKIECEKGKYSGSYSGTATSTVELTPSYSGCKIGSGNATVTVNGCKFVLTGHTDEYKNTSSVTEGEDATISLNCSDTGNITVDGPLGCVITFSDTHPAGTKVNQNLLGVKYDNELESPTWDVKATFTVDSIVFTANSKCPAFGVPVTGTDGFLTTNVTFKAYSDAAHTTKVNLTVS